MAGYSRMHLASTDERNAAFDAVYTELLKYVTQLPWMVQSQVRNFLEGPQGKAKVLEIVDIALDAAEEVETRKDAAANIIQPKET